jgi:DNA polymerase III sliding clamp (beta) subunit (PCNA family)
MRIATDALRQALKTTAPATRPVASVPLLSAVQITASPGAARFATTDFEAWISTKVATLEDSLTPSWSALVSHKLLDSIAKAVRAKEVTLTLEGHVLTVRAGRSVWTAPQILGDPPAWPRLPRVLADLDAARFANMVAKVAPAASDDDAVQRLRVVEVAGDSVLGTLTLAATDRYRMHIAHTDADVHESARIYPEAKSLAKIAGMLAGGLEVRAEAGSDLFGLATATTSVLTRTIQVDTWVQVADSIKTLQRKIKAQTRALGDALADAVKGAAVALGDDRTGVRIEVNEDSFTVAADDQGGSTAGIVLDDHEHTGPGLVSYIAPKLLLPILGLAGEQEVAIDWTDPQAGVLFSIAGVTGTFLVMPLRNPASGWTDTGEVEA